MVPSGSVRPVEDRPMRSGDDVAAPVMATCMVYFCFIWMIGAGGMFKTILSLVGDRGALAFGMLFLYLSSPSCSERGIAAAAQTVPTLLLCVVGGRAQARGPGP